MYVLFGSLLDIYETKGRGSFKISQTNMQPWQIMGNDKSVESSMTDSDVKRLREGLKQPMSLAQKKKGSHVASESDDGSYQCLRCNTTYSLYIDAKRNVLLGKLRGVSPKSNSTTSSVSKSKKILP